MDLEKIDSVVRIVAFADEVSARYAVVHHLCDDVSILGFRVDLALRARRVRQLKATRLVR